MIEIPETTIIPRHPMPCAVSVILSDLWHREHGILPFGHAHIEAVHVFN